MFKFNSKNRPSSNLVSKTVWNTSSTPHRRWVVSHRQHGGFWPSKVVLFCPGVAQPDQAWRSILGFMLGPGKLILQYIFVKSHANPTKVLAWSTWLFEEEFKNFVRIHHALRVCSHYLLEQSQSLPPFWSIKVSLSVCWSIKIKPQPSSGGGTPRLSLAQNWASHLVWGVPPPDLKRNHPRPANNTLAAWNDPAYMVPSWLVRCQFLEREICS